MLNLEEPHSPATALDGVPTPPKYPTQSHLYWPKCSAEARVGDDHPLCGDCRVAHHFLISVFHRCLSIWNLKKKEKSRRGCEGDHLKVERGATPPHIIHLFAHFNGSWGIELSDMPMHYTRLLPRHTSQTIYQDI